MVKLFEKDTHRESRQSSKGNQLKWCSNGYWYKADYTGYEGLAEYMVSRLLEHSNLEKSKFISYDTEQIQYGVTIYRGCKSMDFLQEECQMITMERLFYSNFGESLSKSLFAITNLEERIRFLVNQTIRLTGLEEFGNYLSQLLAIDALFLNEDRHMHNIAVVLHADGKYSYCPIFDNGAALLSDITMDYPMGVDTEQMIAKVQSKTFDKNFDEQLDAVEKLYGQHVKFCFGEKDIQELLEKEQFYSQDIKERVHEILIRQRRKYKYLFS